MSRYTRNTLDDFRQPVSPQDVAEVIEIARGRRCIVETTPVEDDLGYRFQEYLGVSRQLVIDACKTCRTINAQDLSGKINAWLATTSDYALSIEICDGLLSRTETYSDDKKWEAGFARLVAHAFDVPDTLGRKTFHTDAQRGKRWCALVAVATADAIVAHRAAA